MRLREIPVILITSGSRMRMLPSSRLGIDFSISCPTKLRLVLQLSIIRPPWWAPHSIVLRSTALRVGKSQRKCSATPARWVTLYASQGRTAAWAIRRLRYVCPPNAFSLRCFEFAFPRRHRGGAPRECVEVNRCALHEANNRLAP